jgi:IS30 family transposase
MDFLRFVELILCVSADSASTVKALLAWFGPFGVVKQWVSDQGSHFMNEVMEDLAHKLQAKHHFTVVYAPWSNGQVERKTREESRKF